MNILKRSHLINILSSCNFVSGTMKMLLSVVILLLAACSDTEHEQSSSTNDQVMAPINLKVGEGFYNPLGFYNAEPRFSWKIDSSSTSTAQKAYQIQVANSADSFSETNLLWDSLVRTSADNNWIKYQGKALESRQKVFWRVRIWDDQDKVSKWSEVNHLELGLLTNNDWQAKWIGHPDTQLSNKPSQKLLATPQLLRTNFNLARNVAKARLYVTSKGVFKAYINGEEVAPDDVLTPGWTPYKKRIETLTYDVSKLLSQGDNSLAASIASGWYAGRVYKFTEQEFLLPSRFIAQLEIELEDGTKQVITSNDKWQSSLNGPIRFASIYDGEVYEQAKEMLDWKKPRLEPLGWANAVEEPLDDSVMLTPKQHTPVRITQALPAVKIVSEKDGVVVIDFGQNMVGVPKLNIPVIAEQQVTIRFAEALHKGEFYTDNYRSAKSTISYLPSKTGMIDYKPSFTYHGYRYVQISGYDQQYKAEKSWVTALVQHSDVKLTADFSTSAPKLNKLAGNIVWGLRSNFFDVPLDCPQRDERLGWTGDAQVFATPSMYMADVYGFWSAWLKSMREEQTPQGMIPLYVPFVEWINWASSGWGDAATIIPWELYVTTGDKQILEDNFSMMLAWVKYHETQSENNISTMKTFGDWLQPYPAIAGGKGNRGDTDFNLISTAYYAHSVELTLNAAKVLNKQKVFTELTERLEQIKNDFRRQFFDSNLAVKSGDATQTTYLLGLAYDLFLPDQKALAQEKLIQLINAADNHLRTGFLGTPLLAGVLQDAGRSDLVYDLIFKETYPSWFYSINNGATTTWERWNSYSIEEGFNPEGMNSLNHYAYGSISRWFYEGILGITPSKPGYKEVRIAPQLNERLKSARGSYNTPQGLIDVHWNFEKGLLSMQVMIPKNTIADIELPAIVTNSLRLNDDVVSLQQLSRLKPGTYTINAQIIK